MYSSLSVQKTLCTERLSILLRIVQVSKLIRQIFDSTIYLKYCYCLRLTPINQQKYFRGRIIQSTYNGCTLDVRGKSKSIMCPTDWLKWLPHAHSLKSFLHIKHNLQQFFVDISVFGVAIGTILSMSLYLRHLLDVIIPPKFFLCSLMYC